MKTDTKFKMLTKSKIPGVILLVLIFALGIWLRTYHLPTRYGFGWDQQDDAVKVMGIISGKGLTLIGPRVSGPDSFFVSPWHYYFLVPFYWLGIGNPSSGEMASLFVGIVTIGIYYLTAKKLWGRNAGLLAAWGSSLAYSIVCWNVMYTPALTALVFYLGSRMFDEKKYILPAIVLAFFAGTVHLVSATLLILIFVGILLIKKQVNWKVVLAGLLIGSISILPLVLFDFRHNFLNFKKIIEFVGIQGNHVGNFFNFSAWETYFKGFALIFGSSISKTVYILERIMMWGIVLYGIFLEKIRGKKIWYMVWFVLPALILLFYHNNIPEYYFGVSVALFPFFLAKSIFDKKELTVIIVFLLLMTCLQVRNVLSDITLPSLSDKEAIVDYMIQYSNGRKFNFSYNVPFGDEVGYAYLFSWRKVEPQTTNDARLYTLIDLPEKAGERVIYRRGDLGIVER